ncbi:MAG: hypothetical protein K8T26_13095 [Lentisphaerae bacterium]|nr:hypothetical protein [Lentisphaerota bacterium]
MKLAVFVSPHGMGHAARAAAILAALHDRLPALQTHLYTLVPAPFFRESGVTNLVYRRCDTDLGLVQKNPLEEDVTATLHQLARRLPFDNTVVRTLAAELLAHGCRAVLCDIAPLGLAVARTAGLPSILVENFTWDWIYAGYAQREPAFTPFIDLMRATFALADFRMQTEPVCLPLPGAFQTGVVSRRPRTPRDAVRARLGLAPGAPAVLLTGGVIPGGAAGLAPLRHATPYQFIAVGGQAPEQRDGQVVSLPTTSDIYHPDLVHACDVVVGKLGYSTLAEVYHAGVPFAYLTRDQFRESKSLEAFAVSCMPSQRIAYPELVDGGWIRALPALLAQPRVTRSTTNGAERAADWLVANVLQPGAPGRVPPPQPD